MNQYCLVISNAAYANSADVFNVLDADTGGRNTFSVKVSNDGGTTLTNWMAYTTLSPETYDAIRNMSVAQFSAYVDQMAAQKGRTPVGSSAEFKNSVQMSETNTNPWAYIASLGLAPWSDPSEV